MYTGIDFTGNSTSSLAIVKSDSLYTYRFMTKLRKASFLLYQSHPFSLVASGLEVSLFFFHVYVCMNNPFFFFFAYCRLK